MPSRIDNTPQWQPPSPTPRPYGRAWVVAMILCLSCFTSILPVAAEGPVRGLEPITDILPWHHETYVTNATERPLDQTVEMLLSKSIYPAEDGHLDVVLWLDEEDPLDGYLEVILRGPEGGEFSRARVAPIPHNRLFFSYDLPSELAGTEGELEVTWRQAGRDAETARQTFQVAAPADVATSGRIALTVPNDSGAVREAVPMTAGVPFPRGALRDEMNVRLIDETGAEIPLQTEITGRWSRFGPIRWLLCDFTLPLAGESARVYLEYGPDIVRTEREPLSVHFKDDGFPDIEAGRVAVRPSGLYFDVTGEGDFQRVLGPESMYGGFVEHEDGRIHRMAPEGPYRIEEEGSEKISLFTDGYYRAPDGTEFCRYTTRYRFHRDSPVVQLVHTWIFTGDGNTDRIRNMGWRLELDDNLSPDGFLRSFQEPGDWLRGGSLLQHDYELFDLLDDEAPLHDQEGRLPGVMAASGNGARVLLGVKDFWQNFPSELEFLDGALYFHNWPRHGRAARHSPATLDDAIRLWFVHEGEMLDFRLPEEFVGETFYNEFTAGGTRSFHYEKGRPETANAQGIARTEEIWIVFAPEDSPLETEVALLEGWNEETIRAVVDPVWMAASGVFYEIHHRDVETYPEHERIYEEHALAPQRWNERVGLYGMWVYGDTMHSPNLRDGGAQIYRGLRKSHHGWPYSWIPFVRSGDPRFLRLAHAGTRQMYDANHCLYATADIDFSTGPDFPRRRGIWFRSHVPWAGRVFGPSTRSYQNENNYLWHAWYVTGDRRALDILEMWMEEVKIEEPITHRGAITVSWRTGITLLKAFVEAYEGSFDPWFLVAAHAMADLDLAEHKNNNWLGHTWQPGPREFLRFSGDPEYREYYLAYARDKGSESNPGWASTQPQIETNAFAWWLTGDGYHLARLAGQLDWARQSTYEGDVEWYRGFHTRRAVPSGPLFTSWYLYQFPLALAAFEASGGEPAVAIPNRFSESGASRVESTADGYRQSLPRIAFQKTGPEAIPVELSLSAGGGGQAHYRLTGPDGEILQEERWNAREVKNIEVPGDAPEGTYWISVDLEPEERRAARIKLPVTPSGTPEVVVDTEARFPGVGGAEHWSQFWFQIPEETQSLEVDFTLHGGREYHRRPVRRVSLWDGDGQRIWDRNVVIDHIEEYAESEQVEARVEIEEGQQGTVWRMTLPGDGLAFHILNPEVRPIFAVAPGRWFDPGETPP